MLTRYAITATAFSTPPTVVCRLSRTWQLRPQGVQEAEMLQIFQYPEATFLFRRRRPETDRQVVTRGSLPLS